VFSGYPSCHCWGLRTVSIREWWTSMTHIVHECSDLKGQKVKVINYFISMTHHMPASVLRMTLKTFLPICLLQIGWKVFGVICNQSSHKHWVIRGHQQHTLLIAFVVVCVWSCRTVSYRKVVYNVYCLMLHMQCCSVCLGTMCSLFKPI